MTTVYRRNPAVEGAPLHEETILFEPGSNKFCMLNGTAAFLWERLRQPATVEQLSADVCQHFTGVDKGVAEVDVRRALEELRQLAIVEYAP